MSRRPVCEQVRRADGAIAHTPGLTNYGDNDFALFLRKAFIKGAGYSDDALDRKIIGIVDTGVGRVLPRYC